MSEVNVQIQNPQQTVNINNPSIVIEIPTDSIEVEITEQALEIQVQSPVIEVNIGGPCDCSGGGHAIEDEGTPLTQRDTLNFTGAGVTVTDAGGKTVVTIPGGGGTWGSITGTLSDQTDLQTALDGKVDENAAITGATKTKITYDAKGLVTAGDDAAIADITGLQDELDGKAETSHTHTFADIESGVLPDLSSSATVQPSGAFEVKYDGGIAAIQVLDDDESATIQAKGGGASISVGATGAIIIGDPFVSIESDASTGDAGQVLTALGDGTATWQDAAGGGGSVEIIDITYADMETALSGSTLTPGQFYRITDASGTDLGFICQAIRENEITVNGQGGYLNADFQGVGDYGNTPETFNEQKGIWRTSFEAVTIAYTNLSGGTFAVGDTITGGNTGATATIVTDNGSSEMTAYMTSPGTAFDGSEMLDNGSGVTADMDGAAGSPEIVLGDVVIWNLLHYQLTDDMLLNGDNPENNTDAYTLLDKETYPETYVTAWDISEFDFENNWLQYRQDLLGNLIRYSNGIDDQNFGYGFSIIPFFQWGNADWYGNISNDGAIYQPNSAEIGISGNVFYPGAFYADNNYYGSHFFQNNVLYGFSEHRFNTFYDNTSFRANTQNGSAFFNSNTLRDNNSASNNTLFQGSVMTGIVIGAQASPANSLSDNILENGAVMAGITAGANCSISRNKIGQGATLGGDTTMGDGAQVNGNIIGPNAQFLVSCEIPSCEIENNILENSAGIFNITSGLGLEITTMTILQGGNIQDITAGEYCAIKRCYLGQAASITSGEINDGGSIETIIFGPDVQFSGKTIEAGILIGNKSIDVQFNETETISENVEGKRAIPGFSDIPATIDIAGLTTLDITAAKAQYCGIINVTSDNATETISQIDNAPTQFPFTIRPAAGLVLTITGTAYSGIASGQIALKATDYVLDGDKGEYIVLEIDPLGSGCLVEKLVVNGLI